MPYIEQDDRNKLASGLKPSSPGELNYAITRLVDEYLIVGGKLRYESVNTVIGVLECAKLELYRRIAAPYEDKKRVLNGEVYRVTR